MPRKSLKQAYERLDAIEYTNVIKDTLIPLYDDYDGKFITMLTPETVIEVKKHYYNGMFMGWNIYADGVLLETKSSRRKAERYVKKLGGM